jgi:hypothetical protein
METQTLAKQIDRAAANRTAAAEARVLCRLGGRVRDFQLVLRDEGLVLRGQAHTYYAKQLAQHTVMEATELPILANDIEVC